MLRKGKIIVIEGIDKAGKGTQSNLLQSRLLINALKFSGNVCTIMDFPDYTTPIGQEIRAFLDGNRNYTLETKHILMSANRWEKKKEIESMIENDTIIIMNRYYQSNLVYGVSHGLNLKWLLNLDKGLPKEDVVIVLEVNPNTSYQRVPGDRDAFEIDRKLLTEVHKNYRKLAKQFNWRVIDGERVSGEVHSDIMKVVRKVIKA
ncbi:MAG TPA: dTMP kinase [Nitrososphaeraceae archaeon]|nr:dTMP kinase [Nitrososphaeraceae archaeon]